MKIPEDIYFFQLPRTNMLVENEKNVKFNFFLNKQLPRTNMLF